MPFGQLPPQPPGYSGFAQSQKHADRGGMASNPQHGIPPLIAPHPESVQYTTSHPPSYGVETHDDNDSSPDSEGTVTGDSSRSLGKSKQGRGMSTAQFFSSKADESLRFLTAKQEGAKAQDQGEWKDELKGKRVWRVGGLGMWAYDQDEKVESAKGAVWRRWGEKGNGQREWLETARERTNFYNRESQYYRCSSRAVLTGRNPRCQTPRHMETRPARYIIHLPS